MKTVLLVPGEQENLPEVKIPTLFVTHVAEWSTHTYIRQSRPRGVFVGLQFNVEALFQIPSDAKLFRYNDKLFKHAATQVAREVDPPPPSGLAEEYIYDATGAVAEGAIAVIPARRDRARRSQRASLPASRR